MGSPLDSRWEGQSSASYQASKQVEKLFEEFLCFGVYSRASDFLRLSYKEQDIGGLNTLVRKGKMGRPSIINNIKSTRGDQCFEVFGRLWEQGKIREKKAPEVLRVLSNLYSSRDPGYLPDPSEGGVVERLKQVAQGVYHVPVPAMELPESEGSEGSEVPGP